MVRRMVSYMQRVETLAEAQGLWYLCPLCFAKNKGSVGTHWVDTTFRDRGVPDHLGSRGKDNKPTRWAVVSGSGLADIVLSPSIQLLGGCAWHGFVGMSGAPPGHVI